MYSDNNNIKTEIMTTLNEILNSDFLNEMIINDDKQLEKDGWSYDEVRQFAKSLNKNVK